MQLICPHCQFSRELDPDSIPATAKTATCPRCQGRFPLSVQTTGIEDNPSADLRAHPKAGFWIRGTAMTLDAILVLTLQAMLGGMLFLAGILNGSGDENLALLVQLFSSLLSLVYYIFFTGYCGQTPGKMALRIKVVRCDGSPLTYGRAAFRELPAKFISGIILAIGYLLAAFDDQKQALHDRMSDTYVIKL
ncbi:MAG: hypothetical protein C0618_02885 [Desulfuromonas sp.]|nr:MAG: hypothetical protein C0618_02885 [Desulfuromonas sp.]